MRGSSKSVTANSIPFDNAGTSLVSTNAQDGIIESFKQGKESFRIPEDVMQIVRADFERMVSCMIIDGELIIDGILTIV